MPGWTTKIGGFDGAPKSKLVGGGISGACVTTPNDPAPVEANKYVTELPAARSTRALGLGERIAAVAGEKYKAEAAPSPALKVTPLPAAMGTLAMLGTRSPISARRTT
jgi:hypothetical protein